MSVGKTLREKLEDIRTGNVDGDNIDDAENIIDSDLTEETENENDEVINEDGGEPSQSEQEEYTPNYKFSIYDEEREFDDFIKPHINKDNEQQYRDLLTKAYGLDVVKSKLEKTREDLAQTESKYGGITKGISQLQSMLDKKKYSDVFKALKINDDDVFEYVSEKLNYQELPEDQRMAIDRQQNLENQAKKLEYENQMLQAQQEQMAYDKHQYQMNTILNSPDIKRSVDDFDSKFGKDSFQDEVAKVGLFHYRKTGEDLTVPQAVDYVMKRYGYSMPTNNVNQPLNNITQAQSHTLKNKQPIKVTTQTNTNGTITNHSSGGTSAVQKEFISLKDIRNHAAKLQNERLRR